MILVALARYIVHPRYYEVYASSQAVLYYYIQDDFVKLQTLLNFKRAMPA
jgi:hypothetical protein